MQTKLLFDFRMHSTTVPAANSLQAGSKMSLHSGNMFRVVRGGKQLQDPVGEGERRCGPAMAESND